MSPDTPTAETDPEIVPMSRSTHRSRNAEVDFRGENRSNATHASTTDPEARLYKKAPGTGTMLCFMGHALMENRHGLIVQGNLTQAMVVPSGKPHSLCCIATHPVRPGN